MFCGGEKSRVILVFSVLTEKEEECYAKNFD